ncbi:hypothetical protein NCAS_0H03310 [Naumovozyma castellii]|uniref:CHY-type domain-containing protein n=1 Tax=Naumovozyma castellii TaxID=27288 RepID=G0VJG2_NAUCA|nr:hypothetical protein NCAS_0H03310 [Naumovozyma castellii CBS 4309]CCC71641.1 hypothetical protein NCAS_0H03310 [Naumovozyma castellii CBS 4309]
MDLIHGDLIDNESRCTHWHSNLDIISLKFKCCPGIYWACYQCHQEQTTHPLQKFDLILDKDVPVIICGHCYQQMTFDQYQHFNAKNQLSCSHCNALFNPGCQLHYHLYFDNATNSCQRH